MSRIDEDDDFDGEEETQEETSQSPAASSAKPTARMKPPKIRKGLGAAQQPALPRAADELWGMIVSEILPTHHRGPSDVRIQVVQMDPPSAAGDNITVGAFSGQSVQGTDDLPGSIALINYIADHYHMPRPQSRGTVRYMVKFLWAQNSQNFARGDLTLPPREEIIAVRNEEVRLRQAAGEKVSPYQPPPPPPPQGFGAPPPNQQAYPFPPSMYPPPSADPMPQIMQMMQDMWRAHLEGRQPQMPPPGFGAPPAATPINEDAIVAKTTLAVVTALEKLGVIKSPAAAGVAAPPVAPPPAPPVTPRGMFEKAFDRMLESAVQQFTGGLERSIKSNLAGLGKPPDDDDDDGNEGGAAPASAVVGVGAPNPTTPAEPPDDGLPFRAVSVPEAKWGDGRPVVYTENKETGDFDWKGALIANPIVGEKVMDLANGLGTAVMDIVKRVGERAVPPAAGVGKPQAPPSQPAPQIVGETPTGAIDATPPDWKT